MKRLCFGTYASVLRACIPKKNTKLQTPQKRLIGMILKSVNSTYDISHDDYSTSRLLSCDNRLSADIIVGAQSANTGSVAEYFDKNILPMFDPNKTKQAVLALRDIIVSDKYIDEDTIVDLVNGTSKKSLLNQIEFDLANFLAGVFLYTIRFVDKSENAETEEDSPITLH